MATPPKGPGVLFFGVWSRERLGHNLYLPGGLPHYARKGLVTLPEALPVWRLDANYCRAPEYRRVELRRRPPRDPHPENQSEGFLVHESGWTLLAVWDRTGDTRFGSNAVLLAEERHSLGELLAEAETAFPDQVRRIRAGGPFRTRNAEWELA
jgi:hypothetical protein